MKISLTEYDLKCLVEGRVIKKKQEVQTYGGSWGTPPSYREVNVEICLQDIGFVKIAEILKNAMETT